MVRIRNKKPLYTQSNHGDLFVQPQDQTPAIDELRQIQHQLQQVNKAEDEEVLDVLDRYSDTRKHVYGKRSQVIATIPDFWLTVFLSHDTLGKLLTEEDQEIFKYLDSLEVEESKDCFLDYSIMFNFKSNPFFENSKLKKTFTYSEGGARKITGTIILWKEGKGPYADVKRLRGHSFFNWFTDPQHGVEKDVIADLIKDDVWPNPSRYVTIGDDGKEAEGEEDSSADRCS